MRINKYLASCGLGSRRGVEELIVSGVVKVNGKTVVELAFDVNEDNDSVTVNGKRVRPVTNYTYVMLHKPKGCICSANDEKGRKTVYDYVDVKERLVYVGRLDYDTEGLLIMTNDGDLVNKLTAPINEIPKTYLVKIEGEVTEAELATIRKGVVLDGVKTKRTAIRRKETEEEGMTVLYVTITEGRNRQIRRMFESIGKEVVYLKRIAIGDLRLGGLARGAYRFLTDVEIEYLKRL